MLNHNLSELVVRRQLITNLDYVLEDSIIKKILYPNGDYEGSRVQNDEIRKKLIGIRAKYLKEIRVLTRKIHKIQTFIPLNIALYHKLPKYMVMEVCKYIPMTTDDYPNLSCDFNKHRLGSVAKSNMSHEDVIKLNIEREKYQKIVVETNVISSA